MTSKRSIIFRILMLLYIATVAFLCFAQFNNLPSIARTILGIETDKIVHFCMFLPFPILAFLCFDNLTTKFWHSMLFVLATFTAGCIVAGATEYIQGELPYRTLDIADFRADMLALALSSITVYIIDVCKMCRTKKNA